jgi:hypothetical protein
MSAAFGDGGIQTQWPKIIAKLFIELSPLPGLAHGFDPADRNRSGCG